MRRTTRSAALAALACLLLTVLGAPARGDEPAPRVGEDVRPLLDYRGVPDPTVVEWDGQYVAVSTGPSAPRAVAPSLSGPWSDTTPALASLPPWATANRIWASDLVSAGGRWVLYFSAPVAGLTPDGRCIGVATAASPLDTFVPQERPLVCPRRAVGPRGYDIERPAAKGLPRGRGAIDPEAFRDRDGHRYVLYRTQGRPSSVRIVRVPQSGRALRHRQDSVELFRRRGVVENPTLVRHGKFWVLLSSQNYFGSCAYNTTWRRSRTLEGLGRARKHLLLDQASTGLCGPGGGDLLGGSTLVFHAWTCPALRSSCPAGTDWDKSPAYGAHRALFAATLSWSDKGVPSVSGYVAPVVDPWAPPAG